jgi:predicted enzyme related to lactoylglutathione lyase
MNGGDAQVGPSQDTAIIFTPRMEDLAAFYQEAFRLGAYERSPGHVGQVVGPVYLGFDQVAEAGCDRPGVTLWFTVDDIQATFARLVDLGAEVRYPPVEKPWGALLASVRDLDGNILGLAQRRPDSTE